MCIGRCGIEFSKACCAEQLERLGAATSAAAQLLERRVDGVLGHLAIRGEFASGDADDAGIVGGDAVATRQIGGAPRAGCFDERAQACPHAGDIGFGDARRDGRVECTEHVGNVVLRALRIVDIAVVVGVGGAHIGMLERAVGLGSPRHHEQAALVLGDRDDHGDVVAHLFPWHGDVHALCGADGIGVLGLGECPYVVGPHSGRVHHHRSTHMDLATIGVHDHAICPTCVGIGGDIHHCAGIRYGGSMVSGSSCDGEAQPGIVGSCVIVKVGRCESSLGHGGQVLHGGQFLEPFVQLADAPSAGEVVHPHRCAEHAGDPRWDETVLREDRDHERHDPHEMRRVLAQPLPFVQGLVHESHLTLLEVAQTAMHQLRTL